MNLRKTTRILVIAVILIAMGSLFTWYKFFREVPQPAAVMNDPEMRFKYGSIGGERDAGIPYWIFYVLPRMFPEKIPGPNGLASFGFAWEQGQELPIGFVRKTIGFERVGNNCAVCHTASYREREDQNPVFVTAGPNAMFDLEAMFRFLVDCAKDPRFNADNLMHEIDLVTDLSWIDRLIYRFVLIPITRKRLLERESRFAWIYHPAFPQWGRGRDDAMNLTRYFLVGSPMDDSIGPSDMPSIWNLKKYDREDVTLNWAGDSHDTHSVIIDSALGLIGDRPKSNAEFLEEVKWLQDYLTHKPPPKYPFALDQARAVAGRAVFDRACASCHASKLTGTRMQLRGVDTDPERLWTWKKADAVAANAKVGGFGIERPGLVEDDLIGYNPPFLDGLWLRAPYLHNGSVPTLRDLLKPPAERPKVFWRGYDVYDPINVGFIADGERARLAGSKFDVNDRSNGNGGHPFGTTLPDTDKEALLEYLKTL